MIYEIIGIVATCFVIIAFVFDGESQIRKFNFIGAMIFVVYGFLIKSFSTIFLNSTLILINVYKMNKLKG